MKFIAALIGIAMTCLSPMNGEIVIKDFLSFEGFIDADTDTKDWNSLFVSRARPMEATSASTYFQLHLNRKEIFGYHKNGESEMSVIPPNHLYYVTTLTKDGELDTIEIREKEKGHLIYRVKVDGRNVSVVFAPKGYVDPLRFMDITWAPWSPPYLRNQVDAKGRKD